MSKLISARQPEINDELKKLKVILFSFDLTNTLQ